MDGAVPPPGAMPPAAGAVAAPAPVPRAPWGPRDSSEVEVTFATPLRRAVQGVIDIWVDLLALLVLGVLLDGPWVIGAWLVALLMLHVGLASEGGTIGMRVLGMRLVRARDGERLGIGAAFLREVLVKPISVGAALAGFFWMLDDQQRRTWHDHAASSVVVRERVRPATPAWAVEPAPAAAAPGASLADMPPPSGSAQELPPPVEAPEAQRGDADADADADGAGPDGDTDGDGGPAEDRP